MPTPTINSFTLEPWSFDFRLNRLKTGDILMATITFSEAVKAIGNPSLIWRVGNTSVVTSTVVTDSKFPNKLRFFYIVKAGDVDLDSKGVTIDANSLQATGSSSIRSVSGALPANLNHAEVTGRALLVDAYAPAPVFMQGGSGLKSQNDSVAFSVAKNGTAFLIHSSISPDAVLNASALGMGLYKSVAVSAGQTASLSMNGLSAGLYALVLRDALGNVSTPVSGITLDPDVPRINRAFLAGSSGAVNAMHNTGDVLTFSVEFTEAVVVVGAPRISLMVGSNLAVAQYVSGSNSPVLRFVYTVAAGQMDADGVSIIANSLVLNGGTIRDVAGNAASLAHAGVTNIRSAVVDSVGPAVIGAPAVRSATGLFNQTLDEGDTLTVSVTFSEAVLVSGSPVLALTVGATPVSATFAGGSGTSTLNFALTVPSGLLDINGVSIAANSLQLNGGRIVDFAGNAAVLTHSTLADQSGYRVRSLVDTVTGVSLSGSGAQGNLLNAGDVVTATVGFSAGVTAFGKPSLSLQLGSGSVNRRVDAVLSAVASDGLSAAFTYSIQPGDTDTDGISVAANAIAIRPADGFKWAETGSALVSARLSHAAVAAAANLKVDTTPASLVSAALITPADTPFLDGKRWLKAGDVLTASLIASEAVAVTGSPQLRLKLGSTVANASFSSTSSDGTQILFTHTVAAGVLEQDGIRIDPDSLLPNGSTIRDVAGNPINGRLSGASSGAVLVDSVAPVLTASAIRIVSGSDMRSGYLNTGDVLTVSATFNEMVTVSGTPRMALQIGSGANLSTVQASYATGSGSAELRFVWTVAAGLTDTDGVSVASNALSLNGGTITDRIGNAAVLSHAAVAPASGFLVDSVAPTTPLIMAGSGVNTGAVTAAVASRAGGFIDLFTYSGDSLRYVISGTSDRTVSGTLSSAPGRKSIGLATGQLSILGDGSATLTAISEDVAGNQSVSAPFSFVINNRPPAIATNGISLTGSTGAMNGRLNAGDVVTASVRFSEDVTVTGTPQLKLLIGSAAVAGSGSTPAASPVQVLATWKAGPGGGASSIQNFVYTIQSGQADSDGISLPSSPLLVPAGSRIVDSDNNQATLAYIASTPANADFRIDTQGGTAGSVALTASSAAAGDALSIGNTLTATVTFSEPVVVTGIPTLALTVGSTPVAATYAAGSGSAAVQFVYTVVAGNTDTDGVSIAANALALAGGSITDLAGNAMSLNHAAIAANAAYTVNTNRPAVAAVTASASGGQNGFLNAGDVVTAQVTLSESMTVTGVPTLGLVIGAVPPATATGTATPIIRTATYSSGSGSGQLNFIYTVKAGDTDTDGIEVAANSLLLNGGSIRTVANNQAPATGFLKSPVLDTLKVDTTAPAIGSVSIAGSSKPVGTALVAGDILTLQALFSEAVLVSGLPLLNLTVGAVTRPASYAGGSNSNTLRFTYTVQSTDSDTNGVSVAANSLALNGGSITDRAGNAAILAHALLRDQSAYRIDASTPAVISRSINSASGIQNDSLNAGDVVTALVTMSQAVTVSGTPKLQIGIGGVVREAAYSGGSGTSSLLFTYTIAPGDNAPSGIDMPAGRLLTTTGLITGIASGRQASTDVPALAANAAFQVDTIAPQRAVLRLSADNGVGTDDFISSNGTVNVTGLESGLAWQYTVNGGQSWITGTGSAFTLSAGQYSGEQIRVRQTDNAGNQTVSPLLPEPGMARYIALYQDNSKSNRSMRVGEVEVMSGGTNVALNKTVTSGYPSGFGADWQPSKTVDGIKSGAGGYAASVITGDNWLQIDLGQLYAIDQVRVYERFDTGLEDSLHSDIGVFTSANDMSGQFFHALKSRPDASLMGIVQFMRPESSEVNIFPSPTLVIDQTAPVVTSVALTASSGLRNGWLVYGSTVTASVTFSEAVVVRDTPCIILNIGGDQRIAFYSGTGSTPLVKNFVFEVPPGLTDANGISIGANSLSVDWGSIQDVAGNAAVLAHAAVSDQIAYRLDSAVTRPVLSFVDAGRSSSDYKTNANVITVGNIAADQTWRFSVNAGATWTNGSGSSFPIPEGVYGAIAIRVDTQDAAGNSSESWISWLTVDRTAPVVQSIAMVTGTGWTGSTRIAGDIITAALTFSEVVDVTGIPQLALNVGGVVCQALYASGSRSNRLLFTCTLQSGPVDINDISVAANSLTLNGGSLSDIAGNAATITHVALAAANTISTQATSGDGNDFLLGNVPQLDLNGNAGGTSLSRFYGAKSIPGVVLRGVDEYVDMPDLALGGSMTFEARVRADSIGLFPRLWSYNDGPSQEIGFHPVINGGAGLLRGSTNQNFAGGVSLLDTWQHVAMSIQAPIVSGTSVTQNGFIDMYLDGILASRTALTSTSQLIPVLTRINGWIGRSPQPSESYLDGTVGDFRIYNRARTAAEVASDVLGIVDTSDTSLVAYHSFATSAASGLAGQSAGTLMNGAFVGGVTANRAIAYETGSIAQVRVTAVGMLDGAAEKLTIQGGQVSLDGSAASGSVTLDTDAWNWSATGNVFTFTLAGGQATVAQTDKLLQSVGYLNLQAIPTEGNRALTYVLTNLAGLDSEPAVFTIRVDNTAPVFADAGAATLTLGEVSAISAASVLSVSATDASTSVGGKITYRLTGNDANRFAVDASGKVSLRQALDFEAAIDSNADNVYQFTVNAVDEAGNFSSKNVSLTVQNAVEALDLNGASLNGAGLVQAYNRMNTSVVNFSGSIDSGTNQGIAKLPALTIGGAMTIEAMAWMDAQTHWPCPISWSREDGTVFDIRYPGGWANVLSAPLPNAQIYVSPNGSPIQLNAWNHLAYVWGADKTFSIYVNGQLSISYALGDLYGDAVTNIVFGNNASGSRPWYGSMKDFRVYDDARTVSEIRGDMLGLVDLTDGDLEAYYALNNGSLASGLSGQADLVLGATATALGGLRLLDNATVTSSTAIPKIRLVRGGGPDGSFEKLVINTTEITSNTAGGSGTLTIGADAWSWWVAGADVVFFKDGATAAQAQALLNSINYVNTASTITDGDRTFRVDLFNSSNVVVDAQTLTVRVDMTAPVFGAAADTTTLSVAENTAASAVVFNGNATDTSGSVTYTLSGVDGERFNISNTGAVTFRNRPDFELPRDINGDNVYNFNVTATDANGNSSHKSLTLNVTDISNDNMGYSSPKGQSVIDLGSFGKLILPVVVSGKTFYYWDRSGDGTINNGGMTCKGIDTVAAASLSDVTSLFKYADNFSTQNPSSQPSDAYRFATLNGVKLALPTLNGVNAVSGTGSFTATQTRHADGAFANAVYDDMLAVWDAFNGVRTDGNIDSAATAMGWNAGASYLTATNSGSGTSMLLNLHSGGVSQTGTAGQSYCVALQVL